MKDVIRKILDYPTDTPLKFWLKYWDYRIKELCDLDDYGTQLNSPHFLLLEVISEIEHNDFKNKILLDLHCHLDGSFSPEFINGSSKSLVVNILNVTNLVINLL